MYRNPSVPSLVRRVSLSFLLGFLLVALGILVQMALTRRGIHGLNAYFDDLLLGVLAGVVVFVYEQHKYKAVLEKIRVIDQMNHHVRNALQAIAYAPYAEQEKQLKLIQDAVNRIQWALSEILPGESQPANGIGSIKTAPQAKPTGERQR